MNVQNKNGFQKRLPRLELSNTPTLVVTEKLKRQIDYLHNKVGNKEWSGELITWEQGSITDLDNWKVIAEDIFLADVGSGTFTGYEVDKGGFKSADIVQMYDAFPGLLGEGERILKNHHVHTHWSMGTFFSGTDWEQLEDRGILCNYFIMLIVDFKGDYKAKVAFKGKKKVDSAPVVEFANNTDGLSALSLKKGEEEEVLVVMDMKIEYPTVHHMVPLDREVRKVLGELSREEQADESYLEVVLEYLQDAVKNKTYLVDEPFRLRYEAVIKAIEEEKKTSKYLPNSGNNCGYGKQGSFHYDEYDEYGYGSTWSKDWEWNPQQGWQKKEEKNIKGKKISEMTDREFRESQQEEIGWEREHVKILLNACIAGNFFADKITNPVESLKKLDKKLKSREKREDWLDGFSQAMSTGVFDLWTNTVTSQDALNLMHMAMNYLEEHKANKLVNEVVDAIDHEIGFLEEETNWYENQRGGYA